MKDSAATPEPVTRAPRRAGLWIAGVAVAGVLASGCGDLSSAAALGASMNVSRATADSASPNAGDRFQYVGTNPFVMAEHDPLSTFAVDVDTASYDYLRRSVLQYEDLPPRESVRLEEYVNYFRYDYPSLPPTSEEPFSVTLEAAPSPFDDTTIVRVGLHGKDAPTVEPKPANLVFLVDVSGSMSASNKLPLVKVVLRETVDVLLPGSRVALVTYASSPGTPLPSTPVEERAKILSAIDRLEAGGSTNGAGGIQAAYEQARAHFIPGGVNHVILCTDGDFNVGVSDTQELVDLITEERKSGVTLTALGFGSGNLNDAMMELVSNAGNGFYSLITDQDQAIVYATQRLLATMYIIARDVKVQVAFNPAQVKAYRLLGYEDRALEDYEFTVDTVDGGEIGSGHTVTALYEVVLADGVVPDVPGAPAIEDGPPVTTDDGGVEAPALDADVLCEVRLRYKAPDASEEDPATQRDFPLYATDVLGDVADASPDLRWAVSIAAFAEILKDSPFADEANLPLIETLTTPLAGADPDRAEFLSILAQTRELLAAEP